MRGDQAEGFGFERLDVWKRAVAFSARIYELTRGFPKEELFGLTTQLRRAAVSVVANIAEGTSRSSGKEQARFFEIAYGSLNEIAAILYIVRAQGLAPDDGFDTLRLEILEMCRMMSGLKRSALSRVRTEVER